MIPFHTEVKGVLSWGEFVAPALGRGPARRIDPPRRVRTRVVEATPGRNDPCSCGSGKKFKKCCG